MKTKFHMDKTLAIRIILFFLCFAVFFFAPVNQVEDSNYSMMVSDAVISHGTTSLRNYYIPQKVPNPGLGIASTGYPYQLIQTPNGLHLYFPEGTSILSSPIVAALKIFNLSPIGEHGSYNQAGEIQVERWVASLLCAVVALIFLEIARLWLPWRSALFITIIGIFGTSILSTASRAMWSHTWLIVLLSESLLLISRLVRLEKKPNIYLLATCVSWIYFVRPTGCISIIFVTILVFLYARKMFVKYAITGAVWLALFVAYSHSTFGTLLPPYYSASRIGNNPEFYEALVGNLFSPARGFLVYSPFFAFVAIFYIRHKNEVTNKVLVLISFLAIISHLLAISQFPHWWGGFSYGPRFMTDIVPWAFLSFVIMASTRPKTSDIGNHFQHENLYVPLLETPSIILSSMLAIFFNFNGAFANNAISWNTTPNIIDQDPSRLWSWAHPQFLPFNLDRETQCATPAITNKFDPTKVRVDITMAGKMLLDQNAQVLRIPIKIKNNSPYEFSSKGPNPVNIGVHLLSSTGALINLDFYRLEIGDFPSPGSEQIYTLLIPASQLQNNMLQILPVKEGIAWFSDWGVKPLEIGPFSKCGTGQKNKFCIKNQPIQ